MIIILIINVFVSHCKAPHNYVEVPKLITVLQLPSKHFPSLFGLCMTLLCNPKGIQCYVLLPLASPQIIFCEKASCSLVLSMSLVRVYSVRAVRRE